MSKLLFKMGQACLTTAFCLSITACNKDEFYQKDYLVNDGTTGMVAGGSVGGADDGSAAGGVTAGSTGGSAGGAGGTTGTSTGGTTGGTTGASTGGTTTGAVTGTDVTENFKQNAAQAKNLDIVWVIDDSGSMADELGALRR